jgi:hypothetical protein
MSSQEHMQEVFNKVKAHLLFQKQRSVCKPERALPKEATCAYRGDGGLKCAVGCLISDEAYTPEIELNYSDSSIVRDALTKSGIEMTDTMRLMIGRLQRIHDAAPVEHWEAHLNDVAKDYNLQP